MDHNGTFIKRIPIEITDTKLKKPEQDVDRTFQRDVHPSSYGTPYGGPQSQSIVPGSTGYGEQPGIRTDKTAEDYGMTSGGQDE